ncbi:MAG: PDZ domain-containing protein [Chloroflexota bacterium]|nr:MAG: PDZ domain-containing protein [Chloroflexota bacterium]
MNKLKLSILVHILVILIVACRPEEPAVRSEDPVPATAEAIATPQSEATPAVVAEITETPTATSEPSATVTATLAPLLATLEAMTAKVTFTPGDFASEVIDADDYPALLEQGCDIVRDNYVRDDFNGVDWEAICDEYRGAAETIDDQGAFWDLMESLIAELGDDHSRFVRPDRFASEFNLPREGSGVPWAGFTLSGARENEQLMLWDVCQDGPAADAGLRRGDVLLAINGQPVLRGEDGFDLAHLYGAIYEDADSVSLTLQQGPDREPETVTISFGGAGGCDGWSYGLISDSPGRRIGYVRVYDFGGSSDENILYAIEQMESAEPLDGLILDVRHNPGGNSDNDIALFATGTFGKFGAQRDDAIQTIFRVRGPVRWNETTPLVVLTDGSSHSAAEYFATAMQQSGRAILVGMPTAGNTEGITGYNLADGSLIRLAFGTLVLPEGETLEGIGVVPDVQVPLGEWGLSQTPDVQLEAAMNELLRQITP